MKLAWVHLGLIAMGATSMAQERWSPLYQGGWDGTTPSSPPIALRYVSPPGALWVAAPDRQESARPLPWGLWRADLQGGEVRRIATVDQGMYDVVEAGSTDRAAWLSHSAVYAWTAGDERPRELVPAEAAEQVLSAPSWAPTGETVAWAARVPSSGETILHLYDRAAHRHQRVPLPAGASFTEGTAPVWGPDARVVAIAEVVGDIPWYFSRLLIWSREDESWRIWARPIGMRPSVDELAPSTEAERSLASHRTYLTVPGLPVVKVSAGGPGGYQLLEVDTLRMHVQSPDGDSRFGDLFVAGALATVSSALDRAAYVQRRTDGKRELILEPTWVDANLYAYMLVPRGVPLNQRVAFGPQGEVFLLGGKPGKWRVLQADPERRTLDNVMTLR